jgi:hypothetical protein
MLLLSCGCITIPIVILVPVQPMDDRNSRMRLDKKNTMNTTDLESNQYHGRKLADRWSQEDAGRFSQQFFNSTLPHGETNTVSHMSLPRRVLTYPCEHHRSSVCSLGALVCLQSTRASIFPSNTYSMAQNYYSLHTSL